MSTITEKAVGTDVLVVHPEVVSRNQAAPLYAQIAAHFRQLILADMLPSGYRFPPEGELASQFKVARGTVRAAMAALIEEGLIERVQGNGTFVAVRDRLPPAHSGISHLRSTGERLIESGIEFENVLLERKIITAPRRIGPFSARKVMHIRRLRSLFDGPAGVTDTLLNLDLIPDVEQLSDVELSAGSLHAMLRLRFGVHFTWAERFFSAEPAPPQVSRVLDIPSAAPVLCHEEYSYANSNDCIEYSRSWVRTDRHKYVVVERDIGG